jgi:hypothetical protein
LAFSIITSFRIPRNVKSISGDSFEYCKNIIEFSIEEGNSYFVEYESAILNTERTKIVCFPNQKSGNFTIPDGITEIPPVVFSNCILSYVNMPNTLKKIGHYGFAYSKQLKTIEIPDSVVTIEHYAFYQCYALETVKLSKNCTVLPENLFNDCRFTKIEIPEGVTTIQSGCFISNNNLIEVILPTTIKDIGGNVFPQNEGIGIRFGSGSNLMFDGNMILMDKDETFVSQYMGSVSNFNVTLSKTFKTIGASAFRDSSIIGFYFPEDSELTNIQDYAFYGCSNLRTFHFPKIITSIGQYSFSRCTSLTELNFEQPTLSFAKCSFSLCSGLITVNISKSGVSLISEECFSKCTNLKTVKLPPNAISFGLRCFSECSLLSDIEIPESCNVKEINDYSFYGTGLTKFTFPAASTIDTINMYAFAQCKQLTAVEFCTSITKIGVYAFHMSGLRSVSLTPCIIYLSDRCFSDCLSLSHVNIPADSHLVEQGLATGVFRNCLSLATINCESGNFAVMINALFSKDEKRLLVFPPASSIHCLPIPESVVEIGNYAFSGCINLFSIIMSNSVQKIGVNAFEGCRHLHYINIPIGLMSIGEDAFSGCKSLICGVDLESKEITTDALQKAKLSLRALGKCGLLTMKHNSYSRQSMLFISIFVAFLSQ